MTKVTDDKFIENIWEEFFKFRFGKEVKSEKVKGDVYCPSLARLLSESLF